MTIQSKVIPLMHRRSCLNFYNHCGAALAASHFETVTMFYTLAGAAKRTGFHELTILRAIEEGQIAGLKDLFGDWQVHELELRALGTVPDGNPTQSRIENGQTGAGRNLDAETAGEILGQVASDFNSQRLHLPCGSLTGAVQAAQRSTELVASVIFLPGIAGEQDQCLPRAQEPQKHSNAGPWRAAKVHTSVHSASTCEDEIRLNDEDKISGGLRDCETTGFRKLPIRGILLVAIGWIGGLSSYHLFASAFTISKQNVNSGKPTPASHIGQPLGPEKSGKLAGAATPNALVSHPTARRVRSKPILDQEREATGSIKQQDRVLQDRVVTPFPDTRPASVAGWTLRSVTDGTAVLEGPYGTWKAARGDLVPGLGKVESIVLWGSRWIVATPKGLVTTP
jgi:hypothetical protein